jgi:parvulin-like peptidyl-prolyl isomerase
MPLRFLVIVFFWPIFALAQDAPAPPVEKDKQIVAEVNGVGITKKQLNAELRGQLREKLDVFKEEERHVLLRTMLEKMVERLLLLQEATEQDLVPGEKKIEEFIGSINSKLPEDDKFEAQLQRYGVDKTEYMQRLREELGIKQYLDKNVFKGLAVKDSEIVEEFLKNSKNYVPPKEVCARHIFLKADSSLTEQQQFEIKDKAEKIRKMLDEEGSDFATVARNFSQASNRGKGGDLGCFTANQLPREFSDEAFRLKTGEIGQVIKTTEGFHIVKVERIKGGQEPTLELVKDKIGKKLLRDKRAELLKAHLDKLKSEGKVILYYN